MRDRKLLIQILLLNSYPRLAKLVVYRSCLDCSCSQESAAIADFAINANPLRLGKVNVGGFLRRTKKGFVPVRSFVRRDLLAANKSRTKILIPPRKSISDAMDLAEDYPINGNPNFSKIDLFGKRYSSNGYKSIKKAVTEVHQLGKKASSVNRPKEYVYVVDKFDGDILDFAEGGVDSVAINVSRQWRGGVVVHNHPNVASLSKGDFLATATPNLDSAIAVDSVGNIYLGAAVGNGLKNSKRIDSAYDAQVKKLMPRLDDYMEELMYDARDIPVDDYNFLLSHAVNTRLAKEGLIKYKAQINSPYYTKLLKEWRTGFNEMMDS